jgi:nucleoside-diphosphate-sugar epimerase
MKVLFIGGQGPVSAPVARLLAQDNDVWAMARFSKPEVRRNLETAGIHCIAHDLFSPFDDIPTDFDYVYFSTFPALALDPPKPWPDSFNAYADSVGRLMTACRRARGFVFVSSVSIYDPPSPPEVVTETHAVGVHANRMYSFAKFACEAVVGYVSREMLVPTTIARIGITSGRDGGPLRDRLDQIVRGQPVLVHPDGPTYLRPLFEKDCAAFGALALEAGRVPPLIVNVCGDDTVTMEECCEYLGRLVNLPVQFRYDTAAWGSLIPDVSLRQRVLGSCGDTWQQGCRKLVEHLYPNLLTGA